VIFSEFESAFTFSKDWLVIMQFPKIYIRNLLTVQLKLLFPTGDCYKTYRLF